MKWKRNINTEDLFSKNRLEVWSNNEGISHELNIRFGKETDLFGVKQTFLDEFKTQVDNCRSLCEEFLVDNNIVRVDNCMVCGNSSDNNKSEFSIHGLEYVVCNNCKHRYLIKRLSNEALDKFYESDTVLSATLTDKKKMMKRTNSINRPKVEWMIDEYKRVYGKMPKKIVDVGAGAGHFVYAARDLGLDCYGIEPNEPSVQFARDMFNVSLIPEDFLTIPEICKDADIITFWAVLEHLPNFMKFMEKTYGILSDKGEGMLMLEVPRWHSLDTKIQSTFNNRVNRHLFPLSHIQIFSDSSIMNALILNGFVPKGAWFFGMDMYELACQLGYETKNEIFFKFPGEYFLKLQPTIDGGLLSDTMVFSSSI